MHAGIIRGRPGRNWRLAALALLAPLAFAGCKAESEANAETVSAPRVVIGRENFAVATEAELSSGPLISGALEPELAAQVRAEVTGPVVEVLADIGQEVRRGEVLARIDDTALRDAFLSARAALRTAETSLQLAQRNAERTARLTEAGAVAERDNERAQLDVTSAEGALADAKSRLASAEKQLARTEVRAPFTGIVGEAPVSAGDVVAIGALIFSVVDPSTMRLSAAVPANDLGALRVGRPVRFTVTGYGDTTFVGKITRVSPVADATGQVPIRVSVPNADRTLVAGLFAQGRVAAEERTGVVVPSAAVNTRGVRPTVMRVKTGRVERVDVTVGIQEAATDRVEIRQGLAAGDTVLLAAAQGTPVGALVSVGGPARTPPPTLAE